MAALPFEDEYAAIPAHMQASLIDYVNKGVIPGDFLQAVLANDLVGAVGRADGHNLPLLPQYVRWLYSKAPVICTGSRQAIKEWAAAGGLEGTLSRLRIDT